MLLHALYVLPLALALAGEPEVPQVALPLIKTAPTIDGRIDEEEWKHAARSMSLVSPATGAAAARKAVFWIGCDGRTLFMALRSELAPDGRLLTRAVPDPKRDVRMALLDDCVELVVDPFRGRNSGNRRLFHIVTNARGATVDWAADPGNPQNPVDLAWRLPDLQMRQSLADGFWNVEMAVPLASLDVGADDLARPWGLRLVRLWKRPAEESQWGGGSADYDDRLSMPQVTWFPEAPVVRVLSLDEEGKKPRIAVAVFNPHDHPVVVAVRIADAWHRDPPQELARQVTVAPGAEETLVLQSRDGGPEGLHQTAIDVTSPDGRQVFYHRAWKWSMHRTQDPWTVGEEERQQIALQFKYYPYLSKINFRVSVEGLLLRDRVTGAEAAICPAGDDGRPAGPPLWQEPVTLNDRAGFQEEGDRHHLSEAPSGPFRQTVPVTFFPLEKYVAQQVCEVPVLGQGKYVFTVRLRGGEGVPAEPVVQPFVRQVFEWEHNRLGISDEVMPPFTPLEAEPGKVRAVLREHRHGPTGLWDSVTSDGRELLAAPMRFEVVAAGADGQPATIPAVGQGWQVTAKKPTEVVGEARWSAGPVNAQLETRYDYDGMMLVSLVLEPTGQGRVDRLSLVIPLADSLARYMHATSDGLRHNPAGFVPPGEGRVWDSSRAGKMEIPGTFYPYLWLGDGERGLSWFADTDRDWVLDEETPVLDLTRQSGVLTLRVHFITRPGVLQRRHRIVFGLQATPTKPMPQGWRRWIASKHVPGARTVGWVGATFYWGATSYDVYPYHYRFDYFDKLAEARRTGQIDRAFIDAWMKMWKDDLHLTDPERYRFFDAHVNAGFHSAASSPWSEGCRLFGYTNPRGVGFHAPEFATFQDEWLRYRFFNRNWSPTGDVAYDVSPSPSFQDFALWYYRKMLACYDGVYWDNTFLSAHFDPVVGEAWTDEQGRVHPTLGLMHLRDLIKRTAVMLWQETRGYPAERLPPVTLAHMTNTQIVPVNSFLNCTMDWEWKYGYDDFQDRFSPELTVAETIGRQVGAWPTILAGGNLDPKDPRVEFVHRTRLGVALVHELQVFDYGPASDAEIYRRLLEFGYGADDCRVYNYWQEGHPVRVEGIKACTLAMARGGAAVIVVTDYSDGGTCRVALDLERLGLKAEAAAVDFETGRPIERTGPGAFVFPIKKHDFRILEVR